ncbi:MAG: hypothetical protein ACJARD_001581 [Alphaproteobacteria bacterium]|jgi:hypothetical protein
MDNPYRDSFYKLFIEHKFNDQDAINKFALLITDIMQPYNNEALFNRYPHHVGVLNSILAIFNFLPINLSETLDRQGFKKENIDYKNFNSDIKKYIKRYFEKLSESHQRQ